MLPRREIDNEGTCPVKKTTPGSNGRRDLAKIRRAGTIVFHASVANAQSIPDDGAICHTQSLLDGTD